MANVIKHKRGTGSDPSAGNLVIGELAIRTDTGKLFTKMDSGAIAEIAGGGSDIAINTLSSSSGTGGGSATFNGSAYRFTLSAPPNVSAAQLLVSINGVIQKPVTGTGQPSEGFAVDGTDIILGAAPATGSDFFILTFKSLGVSEPADNSVTSAKIVDGAIVNADVNASAAIAGTKISPDFGSQVVTTTGDIRVGHTTDSNAGTQTISVGSVSSGAGGIGIFGNPTNGNSFVQFGDGTASADQYRGWMNYQHASDNLNFGTAGSERLRIVSNGDIGINTNTINRRDGGRNTIQFDYSGSDASEGLEIRLSNSAINGNAATDNCGITYIGQNFAINNNENGNIVFYNNGSERFRINPSGNIGIGETSPDEILHLKAANPVLEIEGTAGSSGDTGVFLNANGNHWFVRADNSGSQNTFSIKSGTPSSSTHRLLINSSGNVGIGTSSPNSLLNIHGVFETNAFEDANGQSGRYTAKGFLIGDAYSAGKTSSDDRNSIIWNERGLDIDFATNDTVRMKIDSSGDVLIGKTSDNFDTAGTHIDGGQIFNLVKSGTGDFIKLNRSTNVGTFMEFRRGSSNTVGSISSNNTTTSYNTSSDYRLKENVTAISDGITRLKTLKPSRFNFKTEKDTTVDGFLAHEVTAVPEAITGTKDEVDSDNKPVYQGIDQSKLVPLLTAALQEAIGRIEALEAK